jgi:FkbM family methyltransferase
MQKIFEKIKKIKKNITLLDFLLLPLITFKRGLDEKLYELSVIKKAVKNWQEVVLFCLGLKKRVTIKLKTGKKIKVESSNCFDFWKSKNPLIFYQNVKIDERKKQIEFRYKNHLLRLNSLITAEEYAEQFVKETYKWLNVKGKEVVDVGAYLGDSAIYFAINEAKHVYAFEPYPFSCKIAIENIKLNNLERKITLLNEAVGQESKIIYVDENYRNTADEDLKEFRKGKKIKVTTLKEIVKRFGLKNAVLKMDCEGCEYCSILNTPNEILRNFEQIIIEYHYGYLNLKKKLEEVGFEVRVSLPKYFFNDRVKNPNTVVGYLYAQRVKNSRKI